MANNGQDSSLGQHMDKIAYAVTGVLTLALLFLFLKAGSEAEKLSVQVNSQLASAQEREDEAVEVADVPDLIGSIRKQWQVAQPAKAFPAWSTERPPALAQFLAEREGIRIYHPQPRLTTVEYLRDSKTYRVSLKVSGELEPLENAEYTSVKLYRKIAGSADKPLPVKIDEERAIASGKVEYHDPDVQPGLKYAYEIRTRIAKSDDAPQSAFLAEGSEEGASEPVETPVAIPYDYSVRVQFAQPFDPSKPGDAGRAFAMAELKVASDEVETEAEVVHATTSGKLYEGHVFGPEVVVRNKKTRLFEVIQIELNRITIRNRLTRDKESFNQDSEPRELLLPGISDLGPSSGGATEESGEAGEETFDGGAEETAPVDEGTGEEGTDDATPPVEEPEEPAEEPAEDPEDAPKPRKRGRGGFQ